MSASSTQESTGIHCVPDSAQTFPGVEFEVSIGNRFERILTAFEILADWLRQSLPSILDR